MTPPVAPLPRPVRIWRGVRDPLAYLTWLEKEVGPVVQLRPNTIGLFQPDLVKHVLQDNHPNYEKGEMYRRALTPLMGRGLFTSEGAFWLRQRRLAQGAFQRAHLPTFGETALECVRTMAAEWRPRAESGESVSLRDEITRLTLQVTLRNLFGMDAADFMEELSSAVRGVNREMNLAEAFLPVHLPAWFPTPGRRRFARSLRTINEFIYKVIAARKTASEPGKDLVGLLISARDPETGATMSELQVRDELVTMLNAGHDTVTDSIVWTLLLLLRNPEPMRRVMEEVDRIAPSDTLGAAEVIAMEYLLRAFHEGMRLYPPGWAFARSAIREDVIGGYRIAPGTMVVISPWVVQRSARYWDRPEEFDPDRFLPANSAGRHKFTYFPFGSGPRQCIGTAVAMMTGPIILANLLARFEFSVIDKDMPRPVGRISLNPGGKVSLRIRERVR